MFNDFGLNLCDKWRLIDSGKAKAEREVARLRGEFAQPQQFVNQANNLFSDLD